jgi:hypothetical protein
MFEKVSLKAMVHYEKLTNKNAFELFGKNTKTATDLRDLVFMIAYTKDNTTTFEKVENLSDEEFQAHVASFTPPTSEPTK